MVIRVFRPRIRPGKEAEFQRYVTEHGLPLVRSQAGCIDAYAGHNEYGDPAAFTIISLWESVEALSKFAGDDWQQPHMTDENRRLMAEVACDHFQSFDA